jgi:molecular chaperone GrpE
MKGYTISNFVHELLPVLDNLQLVLQTNSNHPEVVRFVEGVQMVEQVFLEALGKEKIRRFSPEGDAFNPMQMEAISVEEKPDLEKESVLEVYQPGFIIEFEEGEAQVIRPARVKVGRPAAAAPAE